MGILDDIKALNLDPTDPFQAARAISLTNAAPAAQEKLISEWETAMNTTMPAAARTAAGIKTLTEE